LCQSASASRCIFHPTRAIIFLAEPSPTPGLARCENVWSAMKDASNFFFASFFLFFFFLAAAAQHHDGLLLLLLLLSLFVEDSWSKSCYTCCRGRKHKAAAVKKFVLPRTFLFRTAFIFLC
jgi:hypothetical protein